MLADSKPEPQPARVEVPDDVRAWAQWAVDYRPIDVAKWKPPTSLEHVGRFILRLCQTNEQSPMGGHGDPPRTLDTNFRSS